MNTAIDTDCLFRKISNNDDEQAFKQLFEIYYAQLCLYAKRFIENQLVREDIVQEVFCAIWEKRKSIRLTSSGKNYLITAVKNSCLNYIRKESSFMNYEEITHENKPLYEIDAEDLYDIRELEKLFEEALNKIPETYRLAFVLNRFNGKKTEEVAQMMNVSVRTIERYRGKALEILQHELKDYLLAFLLFYNIK